MTNHALSSALDVLARSGDALSSWRRLEWPAQARETAVALRFLLRRGAGGDPVEAAGRTAGEVANKDETRPGGRPPVLAALVGGASSGKSTVFNNCLGGRHASRVTARGHATLGPILAVHDADRDAVERWCEEGLLLPAFERSVAELDGQSAGNPARLLVLHHHQDALRGIVLFDMPDQTSEMSRREGDVALALLPWFDCLIVVVDHERWFDRQTIGRLRDESSQFGQTRIALFNRSREGCIGEADRARLARQAERLDAASHQVLEFRHGRGLCTFPPGTLDPLIASVRSSSTDRGAALLRTLSRFARVVLNSNAERSARLTQLREALNKAVDRAVPSRAECLLSLMTPGEKRHLDVLARTLRLTETKEWLHRQADRIRSTLRRRLPLVGPLLAAEPAETPESAATDADRRTMGWDVFQSRCTRLANAAQSAAENSDFWDELRRTCDLEPEAADDGAAEDRRERVEAILTELDTALAAWTAKVEGECGGVAPHLMGVIGGSTLAGAIALIAVGGPVAALTLPAAKAALVGALGTIASSAGAGALAGRPLGRLASIATERLIGSPQYTEVLAATDAFREAIVDYGRAESDRRFARASELVLREDEQPHRALTAVCDAEEDA